MNKAKTEKTNVFLFCIDLNRTINVNKHTFKGIVLLTFCIVVKNFFFNFKRIINRPETCDMYISYSILVGEFVSSIYKDWWAWTWLSKVLNKVNYLSHLIILKKIIKWCIAIRDKVLRVLLEFLLLNCRSNT